MRENILLNAPMDETRYRQVLQACALEEDLAALPHGDATQIGERGVTLSGGQRARLGLARAVYRAADVYLLDDPLSAVDARVGKHMFQQCLVGLLAGKTRVLVTHQVHYLSAADAVAALDAHGRLLACGTLSTLLQSHPALVDAIGTDSTKDKSSGSGVEEENETEVKSELKSKTKSASSGAVLEQVALQAALTDTVQHEREDPGLSAEDTEPSLAATTDGRLFQDEARQTGQVTGDTYKTYFRAMGALPFRIFLCFLLFAPQAAVIGVDVYLAAWVDADADATANNAGDETQHRRLLIYGLLVLATVALSVGRGVAIVRGMVTAARNLHNEMLTGVLAAPMRFFDTQPVGRILNRFSKDLGFMDDLLPWTVVDFVQVEYCSSSWSD